jgi:ABC-type transport system involved in cytochrome bd biosynthesis fused ATPase/permease subunit
VLRSLGIGIFIAVLVFALTGGHVFFLPLLFIPLGLLSFGHRANRRRRGWW